MFGVAVARSHPSSDDPFRLRDFLARATTLASDHAVPSVLVGLAATEGDRLFPDLVSFIESELRVEDAVFRLTRDRSLLFLADVAPEQARSVVERLVQGFQREFPASDAPGVHIRYFDVMPGTVELTVKQVLPELFAPAIPLGD